MGDGEVGRGQGRALGLAGVAPVVQPGVHHQARIFRQAGDKILDRLSGPHFDQLVIDFFQLFHSLLVELVEYSRRDVQLGIALHQLLLSRGALVGGGLESIDQRLALWFGKPGDLSGEDRGDPFVGFLVATGHQILFQNLQPGAFLALGSSHQRHHPATRSLPRRRIPCWGEDGTQAKVIGLWDGVVFMVVALGAAHSQSQQAGADDLQAVSHHQVGHQGLLATRRGSIGPEAGQQGGSQQFGLLRIFQGARQQLIAGQHFQKQAVQGFICLERPDQVIAKLPGIGPHGVVGAIAIGIGIAKNIQPVAGPAFGVAGCGQVAVDHVLVGLGTGICQKSSYLKTRRRQAGQIECDTADEGAAVGLGDESQPPLPQPGQNPGIDGSGGTQGGWWQAANGLVEPVSTVFRGDGEARVDCLGLRSQGFGTLADPLLDQGDLRRRHLFLARWHFTTFHALEERAQGWLPSSQNRAMLAALSGQPRLPQVETPLKFFLAAMAIEAVDPQDGADIGFEGQNRSGAFGQCGPANQCDPQHGWSLFQARWFLAIAVGGRQPQAGSFAAEAQGDTHSIAPPCPASNRERPESGNI